ncbi:hypothetical protein E2C01_019475 [Portunus trituberculatus]|uniref:Uncharacterized protein n=1 Tax=Portunus trituberculatus TaxID=210409 RepID=A0A5B7DXR1_PORTR|nr:hypothetical protein [Portunus trituberculatus]
MVQLCSVFSVLGTTDKTAHGSCLSSQVVEVLFLRHLGSCPESERITWAPHLAATIPGSAVPAPISRTVRLAKALRWCHTYCANTGAQGQVYMP